MARLDNILNSFKSTKLKTKDFFHDDKWKEALVFSFFVLLAFGFWLLQSLQQEYEITLNFPVKYKNVPANIAFNKTTPESITAKVKDKGSVLLNYSFGASFAPIEVNLKGLTDKDGSILIEKKQLESEIQKQLIATSTLQGLDPQQIDLSYSQRSHKQVEVFFNGEVNMEPGFQLSDDISITPKYINIYATKEALDSIESVKTQFTKFNKSNKNIKREIALEKINGVNLDPAVVTVSIPIEEYTEKTLEIPVTCSQLPANFRVRMFPATVKVTCGIPLSRFKELSEEMFTINIPYSKLEQSSTGVIPIELTSKPEWVHISTILPGKIEFILERNNIYD